MNTRLFPTGLLLAICLAVAPAMGADKSITPNGKPAPSQPVAKPGSQAVTSDEAASAQSGSYDKVREVFAGDLTVAGEKIVLPEGNQSVKAIVVTMEPGEVTGWHTHGAPLFAYVLEGEITVTYDGIGKKLFREGDGLLEAMSVTHRGENTGEGPARILAVFLLGDNSKAVVAEDPPGADQKKIH